MTRISQPEPDTEELVRRAAAGDEPAGQALLVRHSDRLKRMVNVRMDRRLAARVDPSDVFQDTLVEAARRLPEYLRDRPLPFYPWIRQIALEQVVRQHRRHIRAAARSLTREERHGQVLPDHSAVALAVRLVANGSTPADKAARAELQAKVRRVLARLDETDREVLVLRFLEQLSTHATAEVLELTINGVKSRQARALERFTRLFHESSGSDPP